MASIVIDELNSKLVKLVDKNNYASQNFQVTVILHSQPNAEILGTAMLGDDKLEEQKRWTKANVTAQRVMLMIPLCRMSKEMLDRFHTLYGRKAD